MDPQVQDKVNELMEKSQNRQLSAQEEREMQDGFALQEMTGTAGWLVLKQILELLMYHSWVDPRGTKKEEWEWQELNAFHASNNAKELMMAIENSISRAQHLQKVKLGEITNQRMRI